MSNLQDVEIVIKSLQRLISDREISSQPPQELLPIEGFEMIYNSLLELRKAFISIGIGELTCPIMGKGYLPSALKGLQASMRHLTWQTKAIAGGDFSQSVDFLGEFSEAFNHMTKQLESTLNESARAESKAREAKEYFELIFNTSPDATLIARLQDGLIVNVNQAFLATTYYTRDEVIGETTFTLNFYENPTDRQKIVKQLSEKGFCNNTEMIFHRKSGESITGLVSANIIIINGISHTIIAIHDITERKKSEEAILYLSYHDQLTGLYNRRFYEEELKRLDIERNLPITLVMADVNGLKLTNDAFGHLAGDKLIQKIGEILKEECRADDIIARIGGDEFVLLLPSTNAEETEKIVQRIQGSISNKKNNHTILSVSFGWATKGEINEDIAKVYTQAEDHMYRQKLSESTSMKNETIKLITKTLYEKNEIEQEHCERVSELCKDIGSALGMSSDEVNELGIAGLLHDIGKIGIDEIILNKEEELTDQEWIEMKRHPEIGYQILKSVNKFAQISEIVLAHHERLDGKGYPKGIKDKEIPLQSKILCIAESYDAIISGQIYKNTLSPDMAIQELKNNAGIQFDAYIAKVFVEKVLGKDWD